MNLVSIAKAIKPFMNDNDFGNLQSIYNNIMRNSHISDMRAMMTPSQIIKLVFIADAIYKNEDVNSLITELDNNLFVFTLVEFGETKNEIACEYCSGNGEVECTECYGSGSVTCNSCEGDGTVECPDCDGDGVDEGGEECGNCEGKGKVECDDCEGKGEIDCDYCEGSGNESCSECEGYGQVDSEDFLPYDIYEYASYDQGLFTSLKQRIKKDKRKDVEFSKGEKTFLLNVDYVTAGQDNDTAEIDHDYAGKTYLLNVLRKKIDSELSVLNRNLSQGISELNDFYN